MERHCQPLPHHGDGCIHVGDPAQNVGDQIATRETAAVAAQVGFILGPAVDIVEDRPGQPAPR